MAKFEKELQTEFCNCISRGLRVSHASAACGISRSTFYRHLETDPEFKLAYEDAEETANDNVEHALYTAAMEGDVKAQQIWLYNKRRNAWADSKNIKLDANVAATTEYTLKWLDSRTIEK